MWQHLAKGWLKNTAFTSGSSYPAKNWGLVPEEKGKIGIWEEIAISSISPVLRQTSIQVWGKYIHKFYYSETLSEILKGILKLKRDNKEKQ